MKVQGRETGECCILSFMAEVYEAHEGHLDSNLCLLLRSRTPQARTSHGLID